MNNYIDGFVFPISKDKLELYKKAATAIAEIWKEYGALSYFEFIGDDLHLEGTLSFADALKLKDHEVAVFGWVAFKSREERDTANKKVVADSRMEALLKPILDPTNIVFNPNRMFYGGFKSFIEI